MLPYGTWWPKYATLVCQVAYGKSAGIDDRPTARCWIPVSVSARTRITILVLFRQLDLSLAVDGPFLPFGVSRNMIG